MFLKKKSVFIFLLVVLMPFCSSCSPIQLNIENLIKAPKLSGELYKIKHALEMVAGKDIIFKYPKIGKYNSPFIMCDIDGDGQDEVIVFYSESNDGGVKFNILDKKENEWASVFSDLGQGVEVEKVLISDILGEKNKQLIINWIKEGYNDKSLQVYNYVNNSLKKIYNKDYLTDVFLFDIDNDLKDEIVIVDRTLKITPNISVVKKLKDSNELGRVDYVRLRPGFAKYENTILGKISNDINAIFLDTESEEDNIPLYSEVIFINKKNELTNLFYNPTNKEIDNRDLLNQSMRSQNIFCKDIDGDSIIEIPKTLSHNYKLKVENDNIILPLTLWQKYKDEKLVFSDLSVENNKDGYSFILPMTWFVKDKDNENFHIKPLIIAIYNEKEKELFIKDIEDIENNILSIKVIEGSKKVGKGYIKIEQKNNFIYYFKFGDSKKRLILNEDEVKKRFLLTYGG